MPSFNLISSICTSWYQDQALWNILLRYNDVIMGVMASQITSLTIVYSTVYSGAYQRKHLSSASLAFVMGIHRWPVNSRLKGPVTRNFFPFDDVIMQYFHHLAGPQGILMPLRLLYHKVNRVRCRYTAVTLLTNNQKRHSNGRGMGCLLWIQHLVDILLQFL